MCLLNQIPYREDSAELFEAIADEPWAVFLDSGRPGIGLGRYDILSADPWMTLTTHGPVTEMRRGEHCETSERDPFSLLKEALGDKQETPQGLPFAGGAIGWFSYDLGRRVENLPDWAEDLDQLPEMAVGIYDWAVVVDHQERCAWLVGHGRDKRTHQRWLELQRLFSREAAHKPRRPFTLTGPVRSNQTRESYAESFARIKHYIREGDCYQVNFAQRFSAPAEGDGWWAYRDLRRMNPTPFAAYLNTPYAQVLSASPERFLKVSDQAVETKPIKGTRPRGSTPEGDSELARELAGSEKDRAENLMIVDLLRNDIGRVCASGSVAVPKLFEIESYATVHHLVSTITGRLQDDKHCADLLRACFPGGSITGAPKIRAMEIIEELEPHRRGIYCGSIGYLGYDGAMDSSITIRTLVYSNNEVHCWAGGGIVQDSEVNDEYAETFHKVAALLQLLEGRDQSRVGA